MSDPKCHTFSQFWSGPLIHLTSRIVAVAVLVFATVAPAQIRIATYNTETAFTANGNPNPGLQTVLQGMGNENFNGIQKRIDILTLQEQNNTTGTTTSPHSTRVRSMRARSSESPT